MLETPFSFFIRKKSGEIPKFGTFLAKNRFIFQFWSIFTYNPLFESGHVWKRHFDVIRWPVFMILVSMERGDPNLYHGTKQLYFGPINFKFIGVVTIPLGKPCYNKRLGRTRVNGEELKENRKREGGKLKMEGGKVTKWGKNLSFFFYLHFSKTLKCVLGLSKWEFSTGKKHFTPGKKQEKWLCPLWRIFLLRLWSDNQSPANSNTNISRHWRSVDAGRRPPIVSRENSVKSFIETNLVCLKAITDNISEIIQSFAMEMCFCW